jgi:hypothetical protein
MCASLLPILFRVTGSGRAAYPLRVPLRIKKPGAQQRLPSWTGEGEVVVYATRGERATVWDIALAVALCLITDLLALAATIMFQQRDGLTVCGDLHCYDNPQAHIHDDTVALIAYGTAVLGAIIVGLVTRRNRIPIVLVQAVIGTLVLVNTVPKLRDAQHAEKVLKACAYGYEPPCGHLKDIGPG